MEGQKMVNYDENRLANRVEWERAVKITKPVALSGKVVNASALGLLVRLNRGFALGTRSPLHEGDLVTLEISRRDGEAVLTRSGRVVRLEFRARETLMGLELI